MPPHQTREFQDAIFVRLFRKWSIARENGEAAIPCLHEEAKQHNYRDNTAAAAASLFQLVEAQIGRPLVRECCCSPSFSPDERALIDILRHAPSLHPGKGTKAIPHGLPGALSWAARCLCEAMHIEIAPNLTLLQASAANTQDCPFGAIQDQRRTVQFPI